MAIRILLADDHGLAREMIRNVIRQRADWQITAEAGDGTDAKAKAREECPDLAILDIQMPRLNGIEAAKKIMEYCTTAIVLTESLHEIDAIQNELRKVGIRGFVPKTEVATDLIPAIETVLKGGEWFKTKDLLGVAGSR